ncbi:CAMK/CAMKL/MARK protein kinase [Thecamonas trahens ATCC 50062]|uniref:non-specific serine/threonine protein kinase n=1 Tax=Thecamonas trahens ATCC 50062 TaxID=461836 RepID=A0A0L0DDW5_THETB|nr:CAMK/CAMKL/MARK protein kinase [Thecamonas trahens ATCC 50062]KNC49508.1 CAMK/CAMKL/MARK protein kinase [Thecamonas trahens ATCC 50062]|eukprot:XP_013757625.1 CAMK/CAMKL/MARK protein kinase [Thecamonas trahens ATCC 50062]
MSSGSRRKEVVLPGRDTSYTLLKTIGKGQYGKVKLAIDKNSGRKVAVKIFTKKELTSKEKIMFERELRIHEMMDHPHICKVYEIIKVRGKGTFVVTEYCENGELFQHLLTHGRVREAEARRFFRQLISAVEYVHTAGFVHRDLKLENILLDENFNVKLVDFGFARGYCPVQYVQTSCGSPHYAAPEILLGEKYHGPEVDIWSLGIILYALAVGAMPYRENNASELRGAFREGKRFRNSSKLTAESFALLDRMLTLERRDRATLSYVRSSAWVLLDSGPLPPVKPFVFDPTIDALAPSFPQFHDYAVSELKAMGFIITPDVEPAAHIKTLYHKIFHRRAHDNDEYLELRARFESTGQVEGESLVPALSSSCLFPSDSKHALGGASSDDDAPDSARRSRKDKDKDKSKAKYKDKGKGKGKGKSKGKAKAKDKDKAKDKAKDKDKDKDKAKDRAPQTPRTARKEKEKDRLRRDASATSRTPRTPRTPRSRRSSRNSLDSSCASPRGLSLSPRPDRSVSSSPQRSLSRMGRPRVEPFPALVEGTEMEISHLSRFGASGHDSPRGLPSVPAGSVTYRSSRGGSESGAGSSSTEYVLAEELKPMHGVYVTDISSLDESSLDGSHLDYPRDFSSPDAPRLSNAPAFSAGVGFGTADIASGAGSRFASPALSARSSRASDTRTTSPLPPVNDPRGRGRRRRTSLSLGGDIKMAGDRLAVSAQQLTDMLAASRGGVAGGQAAVAAGGAPASSKPAPLVVDPSVNVRGVRRRISVAVPDSHADSTLAQYDQDLANRQSRGAGASSSGAGAASSSTPAKRPPRTVRVTFASRNVSSRDADVLLLEVQAALFSRSIQFIERDYLMRCTAGDITFEVEILRLPRLELHCINFKRISGESWLYQKLYHSLLASIRM